MSFNSNILHLQRYNICGTRPRRLYNGGCDVVAISRSSIKEIVNPWQEGGDYYRAMIVDEFKRADGTVKDNRYRVLIRAYSLQEAMHIANNYMRQGLEDMRLDKVEKSKILGVLNVE